MAFTVDLCTKNAPWQYGTFGDCFGLLNFFIDGIRFDSYTCTVTGTTVYGAPYTSTSTVTISAPIPNPPVVQENFELEPGTYTLTIVESSTATSQSFAVVIGEYPEIMDINVNIIQAPCSGTAMVEFSYTTGEYASMEYCFSPITPWGFCGDGTCGTPTGTINKTQVITVGPLSPGFYCINLNQTVGCVVPSYGLGVYRSISHNKSFEIFDLNLVPLDIVASSVDTICDTSVGSITIDSINGTAPYTFSWTGPGGYTASTQNISGLAEGTYVLSLTDANGCTGSITVNIDSLPNENGCLEPITCYKFVNCNPDCFGSSVVYVTGADVGPLVGYIINGLQIEGIPINPNDCWTVEETDPGESTPGSLPCYIDYNIGTQSFLIDCSVIINGVSVYTGPTSQADTAAFVAAIVSPGAITGGFTVNAGSTPISFDICAPDLSYSGDQIVVKYQYYDFVEKIYIPVEIIFNFDTGAVATGCYAAQNYLGYNTIFSTCELCQPVECPVEPPYERTIPDPVKIFYQIRESKCDITATKQFATAYSNMLKKIKYGIADCCNGLNIAETWVNKQISDLQATVIPGYNCRTIPMNGCSWLPLQGCEILSTPSDGTSILVIAGEDLLYAKLVMLLNDGKAYLNEPFNTNNYQRAIGFTTMDVVMNQSTRVLVNGIITNPAWSLITGAVYYASPSGGITSIVPTTGISQMIGIAINTTTLFVDIKQPNILC
jgi:hypothetical protein